MKKYCRHCGVKLKVEDSKYFNESTGKKLKEYHCDNENCDYVIYDKNFKSWVSKYNIAIDKVNNDRGWKSVLSGRSSGHINNANKLLDDMPILKV